MLVLSRKLGERIAIDGDIQLEVLEVSGNRVRLGIVAPDDCRIMRAERLGPEVPSHRLRQTTPGGETVPLPHTTRKARTAALPISQAHSLPNKVGSLPVRG